MTSCLAHTLSILVFSLPLTPFFSCRGLSFELHHQNLYSEVLAFVKRLKWSELFGSAASVHGSMRKIGFKASDALALQFSRKGYDLILTDLSRLHALISPRTDASTLHSEVGLHVYIHNHVVYFLF